MSEISEKKQNLKVLWYFFGPYRYRAFAVASVMILSSIFETLNLAALYPIINYGLNIGHENAKLLFLKKIVLFLGYNNLFIFFHLFFFLHLIKPTFRFDNSINIRKIG